MQLHNVFRSLGLTVRGPHIHQLAPASPARHSTGMLVEERLDICSGHCGMGCRRPAKLGLSAGDLDAIGHENATRVIPRLRAWRPRRRQLGYIRYRAKANLGDPLPSARFHLNNGRTNRASAREGIRLSQPPWTSRACQRRLIPRVFQLLQLTLARL
jgi:hypothetical protein